MSLHYRRRINANVCTFIATFYMLTNAYVYKEFFIFASNLIRLKTQIL